MEFLGALRGFLTRDHYASGKRLHLLSEFVFVIPDIRVKEGMVVPQHGIQVQRIKGLARHLEETRL